MPEKGGGGATIWSTWLTSSSSGVCSRRNRKHSTICLAQIDTQSFRFFFHYGLYEAQRRGLKRRVLLFGQNGLNYIPESCYTVRLRSLKKVSAADVFPYKDTPVARNINYPELRIQFLYHLYSAYNSLNKGFFTVLLYLLQGRRVHYIV